MKAVVAEPGNEQKKESDAPKTMPVQQHDLHADRTWYNSLFTQLLAPLVATRYVWLAIEDINPFDFLKKKDSLVKAGKLSENATAAAWKEPSFARYASRNFAAFGMGATFLGITSLYSKNTLNDIKAVYQEAVGYELGKKPEDVTYGDLFLKSQNEALGVTRDAYVKRTLARLATAATFFVPWHKFRDFKQLAPKYDANANVGVGAIGVYLYSEGFLREPSFFDVEQKMISGKINHKDMVSYAVITPQDIQSLMMLQSRHKDKNHMPAFGASEDGQSTIKLAERISTLMNQTYNNTEHKEDAHFTIGKFNFLIGFGLLNEFPESLAYVEMANRSSDMQDVKAVREAIKGGQDPQAVFAKHGIDMHALIAPKPEIKEEKTQEHAEEKFADKVKAAEKPQHKTLHEFATTPTTEGHLAI